MLDAGYWMLEEIFALQEITFSAGFFIYAIRL